MNLSLPWHRKPGWARPQAQDVSVTARRKAVRAAADRPWWQAWLPQQCTGGAKAPSAWYQQ